MIEQPLRLRTQLARALRGTFLLKVTSMLAALAGSVVLARSLGPDSYGIYAFALAVASIIALPAKAGIPTLLVRETAKAQARQEWAVLKGLWNWATRVILCTSLLLAALAAGFTLTIMDHSANPKLFTLLIAFLLIPFIALGNARGAALRGLRLIVRGQLPEYIVRPLLLVAIAISTWLFLGSLTPTQAMGIHVLAAAIAFMLGAFILYRNKPPQLVAYKADFSSRRQWWRAVMPLTLLAGIQVINAQVGIILLGFFQSESEAGIFKVATAAAGLAVFGLSMVNLIIGPHLARLHETENSRALQKVASAGAAVAGLFTLPIVVLFLFAGPFIVDLIYGAEYRNAALPLMILAIGQMVNSLFGSAGLLLNMTGHEKVTATMLGLATAVNVALCLALIPDYGAIGAANATMASLILANVGFWISSRKLLQIDASFIPAISLLCTIFLNKTNERLS